MEATRRLFEIHLRLCQPTGLRDWQDKKGKVFFFYVQFFWYASLNTQNQTQNRKEMCLYIFRSVNSFEGGKKCHQVIWHASISGLKYYSLCMICSALEIKGRFLYFVEDQADLPGSEGHLWQGSWLVRFLSGRIK